MTFFNLSFCKVLSHKFPGTQKALNKLNPQDIKHVSFLRGQPLLGWSVPELFILAELQGCEYELWEFFSSPPCPDRLWDPLSLLSKGYQGFFLLGVKRPRREADHSPPSSTEVKNAWSYTSNPPYVFMAWCLVKAQGQLYLTLLIHGISLCDYTILNEETVDTYSNGYKYFPNESLAILHTSLALMFTYHHHHHHHHHHRRRRRRRRLNLIGAHYPTRNHICVYLNIYHVEKCSRWKMSTLIITKIVNQCFIEFTVLLRNLILLDTTWVPYKATATLKRLTNSMEQSPSWKADSP
jgi:hypothetical protein